MVNDPLIDDHTIDDQLGLRLQARLNSTEALPLPGGAPGLSYGRHRGPAPTDCRVAAVVLAIYQDRAGRWTIPLTLRPSTLQHHGGQICLPGGRVEVGESVFDAALREFEEELGVRPEVIQHCGMLSQQYVYASDNLVHPIVITIAPPKSDWNPDPAEVAKVIPLPLSVLLDDSARRSILIRRALRTAVNNDDRRAQYAKSEADLPYLEFQAAAIHHKKQLIWGATALILEQLAQILRRLTSDVD